MRITENTQSSLTDLCKFYEDNRITYGGASEFTSLLTPCSAEILPSTMEGIQADFRLSHKLYSVANALYKKSLTDESFSWIKHCVEGELSKERRAIQQLYADSQDLPKFIRLDYVTLEPKRQIAEVQWKSGGPGLFIGLQHGIEQILNGRSQISSDSQIIHAFAKALREVTGKSSPVVVNIANDKWITGEWYVAQQLRSHGIKYRPVYSGTREEHITIATNGVKVDGEHASMLIGQSFLKDERNSTIQNLYTSSKNGTILLEPPMNVILQQKWCLSLPFFNTQTDPDLLECRNIIIPTAIIHKESTIRDNIQCVANLTGISELSSIENIRDLMKLPLSVRSRLVLKHAGCGQMSSDSRGVFRLTGSRASAERIIDMAVTNIRDTGSSWILQPYVRQSNTIKVCHPKAVSDLYEVEAFGRYLLFGNTSVATSNNDYNCYAALANFSSHWKVTGSSPSQIPTERNKGSAFTDIRVISKAPSLCM